MSPLVSVLIPVLNEGAHLERALRLVRGQVIAGEIEILAIDGGSRDESRMILERVSAEDPRVRVLDNPAQRIPHALNIGLRQARGEFVARMDAHTWYPPDYLARGVQRLRRGDVAWVSGPALPAGDGKWSERIAIALNTRLGVGGAEFRRAGPERELDTGFAGLWRRETLENHGGWDEGWPVNEDGELAARIAASGGRIICVPEMAARYVPRNSLPALARQYWRYGQYRAKTCRRHPESMRRSHAFAPGLVITLLAASIPGPQRRVARAGSATWATTVAAVAGREAARGHAWSDALALPMVFVVMHVAWGSGFLVGCVRFGPPLTAFTRAVRRSNRARPRTL